MVLVLVTRSSLSGSRGTCARRRAGPRRRARRRASRPARARTSPGSPRPPGSRRSRSTSTLPSPSGTNSPARTPSANVSSPPTTCAASALSTSLRCTCRTRAGSWATIAAGSAPAAARWPVSTQRPMCEPASTRRVSSPVSIIVPMCGCSEASTPRLAAWSAIRSRLASRVAQPASSSSGRASYPSWPVPAASTTMPAFAARHSSTNASTPGSGSWPGSCRTATWKPPTAPRPCSASWATRAFASASRKPGGPNSVATRPRPCISVSTRSGVSWKPQPGTSQRPHEIGAPATRSTGRERLTTRIQSNVLCTCQYFVLTLDHLTYSPPCPLPRPPSRTCSPRSPSTAAARSRCGSRSPSTSRARSPWARCPRARCWRTRS